MRTHHFEKSEHHFESEWPVNTAHYHVYYVSRGETFFMTRVNVNFGILFVLYINKKSLGILT